MPEIFLCDRLRLRLSEGACKARWRAANAKALTKKQRTQGPAEWRMSRGACKGCPIGKDHAAGKRPEGLEYVQLKPPGDR